jgi:hypothetical protein
MAAVSVAAALFAVYKPHRYFFHYLLLLFFPLGTVVGYFFVRGTGAGERLRHSNPEFRWFSLKEGGLAFIGAALVLTLSFQISLWGFRVRSDLEAPPMLQAAEGYLIRYLTSPGSQIFVWGWNLNPYLSSGTVPATRDTTVITSFQSYQGTLSPRYVPTPASERLGAIYRRRMLRDLQAHPPALFIDAVGGGSWFLSQREYWGFELVPSIKAFVDEGYVHLIDIYGQRYFMRRDLAVKREADFNRPLPQRACSPSALRCSNEAITLPHELPPTQIPAHSRIDLEFMPIHRQLGPATVFNTEKTPFSNRGLRIQYVDKDRYILTIGVGDHWSTSKEFLLPQDKVASLSIDLNGTTVTLENNGARVDEIHLSHPYADAGGPITLGSWIGGLDPFSGKIQFLQVVGLDKVGSKPEKPVRRAG